MHKFSELCLDNWLFDTSLKSCLNYSVKPSMLSHLAGSSTRSWLALVVSSRLGWWRMTILHLLRHCGMWITDRCLEGLMIILVQTVLLMDPPVFFICRPALPIFHLPPSSSSSSKCPAPTHYCTAAINYVLFLLVKHLTFWIYLSEFKHPPK